MSIKVLIVEDEFVVANALRLALKQAGYQVTGIAVSAEEADVLLQTYPPDLVLLDIRLEGRRSGIDLARQLRADNTAFIYLSAQSGQSILEEAKATEPDGFLVKPFREKDLLVALEIAWYRHLHSLETKLRREESLQQQLTALAHEPLDAQQKLLRLARILQTAIPFDLLVTAVQPLSAYLRVGFDEYQFIGEQELLTITGQKATSKDLLVKQFNLVSCLEFAGYIFYSRQSRFYTPKYLALLQRLKIDLAAKETGPKSELPGPVLIKQIIGTHPLLLAALDLTTQVAPYNTSVLLLGESGTGKEKVAETVHSLSPRKNGPFIKVNCAAIPPTLAESELFGHEKGSFTGATEKRKGRFEQADGGTIFLDEIGELPLALQVKLLRVLQEKEINYVGGNAPKKVNVRVVAATNRNLEKEIADGNFRLDLYYRLHVFPITLPPLRERKSDINVLARFFAERFCKEFNKTFTGISAAMLAEMAAYDWPGNIRELENVIEQAVILNNGSSPLELRRTLVPAVAKNTIETLGDVKQLQQDTERAYIISVLQKTQGRIRGDGGAAELLDLKPTTLESKMAKLGITKKDL
jgi:DNA-binding NtrC family response regulator